jgi:hypothetical protein
VNTDSGMVNSDSGKPGKLFTLNQNRCSGSPRFGVHIQPVWVFTLGRNTHHHGNGAGYEVVMKFLRIVLVFVFSVTAAWIFGNEVARRGGRAGVRLWDLAAPGATRHRIVPRPGLRLSNSVGCQNRSLALQCIRCMQRGLPQ